jgi:uncharacterized membrane protein YdjX (TVP38/TMEM64 family)
MDPSQPARRKFPRALLVAGALALVALGVAALVWREEARGAVAAAKTLAGDAVAAAESAGPGVFFGAMALLPAAGVPMLAFMLPAGPAFGPSLGMPAVIGLTWAALAANMALTWWLARRALRPQLERLIARLGHRIPQVPPDDTTALIVLLRVTPGVPFFAQNYLLGLAGVPFGRYLLVSCLAAWPPATAWVYFGDKLKEGRAGLILLSFLLLAAVAAGANLVRHHYGKKQTKQPTVES